PMGQHTVDLPGLDVGQQALQGGPVEVAAAIAAVVVALPQAGPASVGLALDVGFGGFALGVQRIEVLVQPLFGAFARVDGTTSRGRRKRFRLARRGHWSCPFVVSPKKKCPEQCEPVTALATALSERYTWPS